MLEHYTRRVVHLCLPLALVYYYLPPIILGVQKQWALILLFLSLCMFESYRLKKGMHFFGLRKHERKVVASYLWSVGGLVFCLLLLPMQFVVPSVTAMAFIDPLSGELRKRKSFLYPTLPIALYALIFGTMLSLMALYPINVVISFTAIATGVGIAVEYPNIKHLDDDFLMMVLPALLLSLLSIFL